MVGSYEGDYIMPLMRLSEKAHRTWKNWCRLKKLNSESLMDELMEFAQDKIRFAEYLKTLLPIDNFQRPLSGCRINKTKLNIQKRGRTCG